MDTRMIWFRKLELDFETFSEIDLRKHGIDVYARHPSTLALMLGWRLKVLVDGKWVSQSEVNLWEPDLEKMPADLLAELMNPHTLKVAWNSGFEFNIFLHTLKIYIPFEQWRDAAVNARSWSLPGSLEDSGVAIGLPKEQSKMKVGKAMIQLFSKPAKVKKLTKKQLADGMVMPVGVVRNDRNSHPKEWEIFKDYCKGDIRTEGLMDDMFEKIPLTPTEEQGWILDQEMNVEGMPVDLDFIDGLLVLAGAAAKENLDELKDRTNLANPNSIPQMLGWLRARGYPYTSLNKSFVTRALESEDWGGEAIFIAPDDEEEVEEINEETGEIMVKVPDKIEVSVEEQRYAKETLALRMRGAKISWKKLQKMKDCVVDGRLRWMFLFLGAARTGRWSGRNVQLQNLSRGEKEVKKRMEEAMALVYARDYEKIKETFKCSVLEFVVSCIRACFQAPEGYKFVVCDLNAIEVRVIGWVSGCEAIQEIFRRNGCPYLDFMARNYGLDIVELERLFALEDAEVLAQRQDNKPPVLGCGFGMGPGEVTYDKKGNRVATGLLGYAEKMGIKLTPEACRRAVHVYRQDFVEVTQFWANIQNAFTDVLNLGKSIRVGPVVFSRKVRKNGQYIILITLPSGRNLTYMNARIMSKPAKVRSYTDDETGEKVRLIPVRCTEVACQGRWKLKETSDPVTKEIIKKQEGFDEAEREERFVRSCSKCQGDTVWERDLEEQLVYDGIGQGVGAINKGWGPVYTYGAKVTENIVQAIARDVLLHGMLLAKEIGLKILGCFHDEILCLVRDVKFGLGLADLKRCMTTVPPWAPGMLLGAEGWEGKYYRK